MKFSGMEQHSYLEQTWISIFRGREEDFAPRKICSAANLRRALQMICSAANLQRAANDWFAVLKFAALQIDLQRDWLWHVTLDFNGFVIYFWLIVTDITRDQSKLVTKQSRVTCRNQSRCKFAACKFAALQISHFQRYKFAALQIICTAANLQRCKF